MKGTRVVGEEAMGASCDGGDDSRKRRAWRRRRGDVLRPLRSYRSEAMACAAATASAPLFRVKPDLRQPGLSNRNSLPNLNHPCDSTRARAISTRRDASCAWKSSASIDESSLMLLYRYMHMSLRRVFRLNRDSQEGDDPIYSDAYSRTQPVRSRIIDPIGAEWTYRG